MQIDVVSGELAAQQADTIVVALPEGTRRLGGAAAALDRALDGAITALLRSGLAPGRANEVTPLATGGRIPAARVVVQGLGKRDQLTPDRLRKPDRRPGARAARPGRRQRRALGAGRRPRGPRRRGDRAHPRRGLRARPLPLRPVPHPRAGQAARIGDGADHRRDLGATGKRGGPRRGAGHHPRRGAELHARSRQLARQPDDPQRRRRAAPRPAPTSSASSAR